MSGAKSLVRCRWATRLRINTKINHPIANDRVVYVFIDIVNSKEKAAGVASGFFFVNFITISEVVILMRYAEQPDFGRRRMSNTMTD